MNKLEIENGKYQIENNNGIVKVYRYGELWLDGVTKFELCLIQRIEELETQLSINTSHMKQLQKENERYKQRIEELELEVSDWRAEVQKWQQFYKESEESHSETKELLKNIVNQNKRYREAINNIIEKVMLFGTNEEVYETIQDAIKALEGME